MSVWEHPGHYATRTGTVAGAILAPYETQRLVVSGKTGHQVLRRESEMGFCVLIDPGGEMASLIGSDSPVLPYFRVYFTNSIRLFSNFSECKSSLEAKRPSDQKPGIPSHSDPSSKLVGCSKD